MTCIKQERCCYADVCNKKSDPSLVYCSHFIPTYETNEDWLRSCSTEELAEFIRRQRDDWSDGWYSDHHKFDEILSWLKEKHNGKTENG